MNSINKTSWKVTNVATEVVLPGWTRLNLGLKPHCSFQPNSASLIQLSKSAILIHSYGNGTLYLELDVILE